MEDRQGWCRSPCGGTERPGQRGIQDFPEIQPERDDPSGGEKMSETRYHRVFGNCLRGSRGITLLELLTVFIIVGILAGIAVPSFMQMRMSQEYRRAARDV